MISAHSPKHAILLSGGSPIALKVVYCLRQAGYRIHLVDIRRPSSARHSRYLTSYRALATDSPSTPSGEYLATQITRVVRTLHLPTTTAIVPSDVASVIALHEAAPALEPLVVFPVSARDVVDSLDDKVRFQHLLSKYEIPGPAGMALHQLDQLDELPHHGLTFPLLLKTSYGESGHGVFLAQTLEQARLYAAEKLKEPGKALVAQEYIDGLDADLSVLCQNGEILRSVLQLRHGADTLEFSYSEPSLAVGKKLMAATKFSGVANIDLRIQPESQKAYAIECNPRFWYTLQASLWKGLNFAEAGVQLAMGDLATTAPPFDAEGFYYLHGHLLKHLLWRPRHWQSIGGYNLQGLYQALSDPVPFIRR